MVVRPECATDSLFGGFLLWPTAWTKRGLQPQPADGLIAPLGIAEGASPLDAATHRPQFRLRLSPIDMLNPTRLARQMPVIGGGQKEILPAVVFFSILFQCRP